MTICLFLLSLMLMCIVSREKRKKKKIFLFLSGGRAPYKEDQHEAFRSHPPSHQAAFVIRYSSHTISRKEKGGQYISIKTTKMLRWQGNSSSIPVSKNQIERNNARNPAPLLEKEYISLWKLRLLRDKSRFSPPTHKDRNVSSGVVVKGRWKICLIDQVRLCAHHPAVARACFHSNGSSFPTFTPSEGR